MKLGEYVIIKCQAVDLSKSTKAGKVRTVLQGNLMEVGEDIEGKFVVLSGQGRIRFEDIESFFVPQFTEFKGKL